jgi:hypothetical protein
MLLGEFIHLKAIVEENLLAFKVIEKKEMFL